MKKEIHPKYNQIDVVCGTCGAVWRTGSTLPEMRVSICGNCHPFYTGEQRMLVDTEGQVDRFMKKLAVTQERQADAARRKEKKQQKPKKESLLKEIYGEEAGEQETSTDKK
jgi:large subunit ribosomal protein L31